MHKSKVEVDASSDGKQFQTMTSTFFSIEKTVADWTIHTFECRKLSCEVVATCLNGNTYKHVLA